ncbi:MAG TPA: S8 family serine peptidase [Rubrivivax sp.]|nr:S8 family serine peptidase [Rubrivivax sp.]
MIARLLIVGWALALAVMPTLAQEKKRVDKAADLPRFSYQVSASLEDTVRKDALFADFAKAYRRDAESVLAGYNIQDKATLRQMLASLAQLDFLENRLDSALARLAKIKELQDKPADKLLSGLQLDAIIAARKQGASPASEAYRQDVARRISAALEPMPFEVIQNEVREMKAGIEIASEALALGYLREVLQPTVDKAGSLSSEFAPVLVNARYRLTTTLPLKQTLAATYADYLAKHAVVKPDIWAARNVELPAGQARQPVVIGIWDSGTDTTLYKDSVLRDASGKPVVIAFDKYSNPSTGDLYPIPPAMRERLPTMKARAKGFSDLQSNVDSPEATEVKQYLSALKPDEYKAAVEELALAGNYLHGTHVTGIAVAGNPYARIATARIEFGYTLKPDPCPSRQLAERDAKASQVYVDFFKTHGVRVVNMSWGGDVKSIEQDLEVCGIGKTPDERKAIAREYFDMSKNALTKAFASAPGILFVTAAGNSNADSTFSEAIPASIVLPNLLTVGAVDQAGDEAAFTSYGPTVKVHANGYQVESTIPGGERIAESGTSMAAPQVAGLAAKMLAVNPKLTPAELIAIIVATADKTPDARRTLINPKKAVAAAQPR